MLLPPILIHFGKFTIRESKQHVDPQQWVTKNPIVMTELFKEKILASSTVIKLQPEYYLEFFGHVHEDEVIEGEFYTGSNINRHFHTIEEFWWIITNLIEEFFNNRELSSLSYDDENVNMMLVKDYTDTVYQVRFIYFEDIKCWSFDCFEYDYSFESVTDLMYVFIHLHPSEASYSPE